MTSRKPASLSVTTFLVLTLFALGAAAFYRLPALADRPMHTDEAILGYKFAQFYTTGHFQYDPKDFHGPGLHYVTRAWSRMALWDGPETWTDDQLRTVAAVCGLLLILTTLLFADALRRNGVIYAMFLTAVSPMMVYYSRYYIMEMLLVLLVALSLASFWRYSQGGSRWWLVLAGAVIGLQHATKETFVLNAGAAMIAWGAARLMIGSFEPRRSGFSLGPVKKRVSKPWLWVAIPAVFVSVAIFSGGFHDWEAVKNSALTYLNYLERSGGSGHEKPWHYYLTLLVWRQSDGVVWTEVFIVALAFVGMAHAFIGNHMKNQPRQAFLVFLSVYALVLLGGYSILAYKTPWSILSAQHALTLLAGYGASVIAGVMSRGIPRIAFRVVFGLGIYHLCFQTHLAIHQYSADPRNPYVYSHTVPAFPRLLTQVAEIQAITPDQPLSILVVNKDAGWPMPWYWRMNRDAQYSMTVPSSDISASVILVDQELLPAVQQRLGGRAYHDNGFYGLRPNNSLVMLVEPALWERFSAARQEAAITP